MNCLYKRILLLGLLVLSPCTAWPATVSLGYSRGSATPSTFNPTSGDITINVGIPAVAKVESVEFFGDFSFAKTGAFSTNHKSNITFSGPSSALLSPGTAKINVFRSGISSSFSEDAPGIGLSAGANVNWSTFFDSGTISITPLDVDLSINTAKSGSGSLGATLTDSDSATACADSVGRRVRSG